MAEATQQGAQQDPKLDPAQKPNAEEYVNPRDAILDSMEEKIDAERQQQVESYNAELRGELEREGEMPVAPDPEIPTDAGGAASVQPMHEPPPESDAAPQQPPRGEDILTEHIVMHEGQPMFKAKIDGQDMLIPLDRARQQIQKHEAAEVRLQNAANMQRQLETREAALQENEAALQTRMTQLTQAPPSSAPSQDVDDPEALLGEAKDIVSSLFTQDEDTAAQKLATLLSKSRAPAAQTPAPSIDTEQIVKQAATVAVAQMTEKQIEEDAQTGFKQFRKDYPDIMLDRNLYAMADAMTDEIAVEHPDWKPSEVMVEAGNRVRKWVEEMKGGKSADPDPNPQPTVTLEDRQQRKEGLVPIPQAAGSAQQELGEEDEEERQTPADVVAEMRASRGQPT